MAIFVGNSLKLKFVIGMATKMVLLGVYYSKRKVGRTVMRIAIAQINPILGDFESNSKKILEFARRARERGCDLVVFPEAALFGYHPNDLLERSKVVQAQEMALKGVHRRMPANLGILLGAFTKNPDSKGRPNYNSAVFLEKGKQAKVFNKHLLPNGDVFDEARFIEAGTLKNNFLSYKGKTFFITICEDIWAWPDATGRSLYKKNPLLETPKRHVDLVINISASPFYQQKLKQREYMTKKTAQLFKAPVLYANLVGAQDEVIYDGGSFVVTPSGKVFARCHQFEEDLNVINLETKKEWSNALVCKGAESLRKALVLGIRDFCEKTGIKKVHLGLSGGIDSAVVACLAVEAVGSGQVTGIALPGPFSSNQSLILAKKLASHLQIPFLEAEINASYEAVLSTLSSSYGLKDFGVTNENIQARLRGLFLMAFSNKENSLLLTTGNKSEYAAGYSTLYGDMCGGLAPIGDLTKNQVYSLAKLYNQQIELIPREIIDRAPTAELRPNQRDQDSLPEYDLLDSSVVNLIEKSRPVKTSTDKWLLPVIFRTEFKRWQAPPILKVSQHSFGRGRRWPIAHRAKEI